MKIRMAVHGGDQGFHLPSILSPATSECQRRVGSGEVDLIPWVISRSLTIFGLENFLSLMCLLYLVIQSGHLLPMHLPSLPLNLCKHFAFTASISSKCPKPTIIVWTTISSFALHQVPVSCICRLLVLVLEETVAPSWPSLYHHDFLHPDYFPLLLFVSFPRDDLGLLVPSAKTMGVFSRFDPLILVLEPFPTPELRFGN